MKKNNTNRSIENETLYIAYANAIVGKTKDKLEVFPLSVFLVAPINDEKTGDIIGFKEAKTQKKIIVSKQSIKTIVDAETNEEKQVVVREDFDIQAQKNEIGNIKWDVCTNEDTFYSMGPKAMIEYFLKDESIILDNLVNIYEQAERLGKQVKKDNKHNKGIQKGKSKKPVVGVIYA